MPPPLVADVNIASEVVQFLRSQGVDVVSACEEGWGSYEDEGILAAAHTMNRFVLRTILILGRSLSTTNTQALELSTCGRVGVRQQKLLPTCKTYSKCRWIGLLH